MDIVISNMGDQPIYDQIYTQIKNQIIAGKLKEGEALPSIRGLAKDLRISVITTKRAYEELERQGFIYTMAGKGSFVAQKNLDLIREENLKKIEEHMNAVYELGTACGLSREELMEMFALLGEGE
ncbi:MAG TPA: GntR family transcriptional regulator [Candidatus Eisenbergiella pullicola]|nr:GntR family transcriptional regulator [Candidatus Eisenbergiella pullicola]